MSRISKAETWQTVGLISLGLAPAVFGTIRAISLNGGPNLLGDDPRFEQYALSVSIHIIGVTIFWLLGIFQFLPSFRRRFRQMHRILGRVWVVAALLSALSGLWLSHYFPRGPHDGQLLYWIRMVVGFGMTMSIVAGFIAILSRKFQIHEAWMMRSYAIGMGAGTQTFLGLPAYALLGEPNTLERALILGLGWVINSAIVEWVLWRRSTRANKNWNDLRPDWLSPKLQKTPRRGATEYLLHVVDPLGKERACNLAAVMRLMIEQLRYRYPTSEGRRIVLLRVFISMSFANHSAVQSRPPTDNTSSWV